VAFELVQAPAAVLAGLGGAAFVTARAGMGAGALGVLALAFGAAAYAVAFSFVERERTPANFYFYASAGLAFVLAGAGFLLGAAPRGLFWAALAVACAAAGRRSGRLTLAAHAAAYAVVAALASGLLAHAAEAVFASPASPWNAAPPAAVVVAAALGVAAWALGAVPARGAERAPRVVLLVVLAAGAAGLVVGWLVPSVAGAPGAGADAGVVATVRTVVLALGAVALAALGRLRSFGEARWLSWPVLGLAGAKLAIEDLPRSRPATLFLALAVYGAALILVPRLRRREPVPGAAGVAAPPLAAGEAARAPGQAPGGPAPLGGRPSGE
jgi:hypothetical protein